MANEKCHMENVQVFPSLLTVPLSPFPFYPYYISFYPFPLSRGRHFSITDQGAQGFIRSRRAHQGFAYQKTLIT
ncbi:hypothetical protein BH18ACI4_BH18ACI4_16590 [soil metagenome]